MRIQDIIEREVRRRDATQPELMRRNPDKGYTKDNIIVVSRAAERTFDKALKLGYSMADIEAAFAVFIATQQVHCPSRRFPGE